MQESDVVVRRYSSVLSRIFVVSILILAATLFTPAQNYRNTITGFVFSPERAPITQIPMEVTNEVGQILQRTKTDGTGRYFFSGLSAGRFTVRALPYGTNYEEQSQDVEIVNFVRPGSSTSENAYKDFYLRLRKTGPERQLSGTVFAQETPDEAKKHYDRAVTELEANKQEAAIKSLLSALKSFPDYYAALDRLGREYIKQQKYDHARAVFLKAVSVNERSFNGWYGLSYAAYAMKQPEIAVEAATKATTLEPTSIDALIILGISQRQAKQFAESEKSLLQAKKLAKGASADVHWNLALLYANNLNKFSQAADELEDYLKIAPPDTKVDEVKKLIKSLREKSRAS